MDFAPAEVVDALAAASEDAGAIHHDLCFGSAELNGEWVCTCGIPALLQALQRAHESGGHSAG